MIYVFDGDVAKEYGVNEAIMIANLQFWIAKNKACEKHFYDDHWWTYNSKEAFTKLFPFWSVQTVKTTLNHLKEKGVIITGNYNKNAYDKTLWYAFADEEKWLNEPTIKKLEPDNRLVEINRPIPDINTDIIPDNNTPLLSPQGEQLREHFKDLWNNKLIVFYKQCYPHNVQLQKITRASLKNLPARNKELKSLVKELIADGVITAEDVGDDVWRWAFNQIWERIQRSSFLRGTARGYEGFVPNAEFILAPSKFIKIVTPIAISKYGLDDKR